MFKHTTDSGNVYAYITGRAFKGNARGFAVRSPGGLPRSPRLSAVVRGAVMFVSVAPDIVAGAGGAGGGSAGNDDLPD